MYQWPGAAGICCQCFEPVSEGEIYRHRMNGRKFHQRCFDRGGFYVNLEKRLAEKELVEELR